MSVILLTDTQSCGLQPPPETGVQVQSQAVNVTWEGGSPPCHQVNMRSCWIRVTLDPVPSVLIPGETLAMTTESHVQAPGSRALWTETQGSGHMDMEGRMDQQQPRSWKKQAESF